MSSDHENEKRDQWKSIFDQIKIIFKELDPLETGGVPDDEYDDLSFKMYSHLWADRSDDKLRTSIQTTLKKDFGVTINEKDLDEVLKKLKQISIDLSARPANWNLTIDDLLKEMHSGKRKSVEEHEWTWAREYELSTIPKNYRFPKQGDVYESLLDQEIDFLTAWEAPFTGGGKGFLFKGERVYVRDETNQKSIGTYADPVEYSKLEERIVPQSDRSNEKYCGFYFFIKTVDLNEKYKLIEKEH